MCINSVWQTTLVNCQHFFFTNSFNIVEKGTKKEIRFISLWIFPKKISICPPKCAYHNWTNNISVFIHKTLYSVCYCKEHSQRFVDNKFEKIHFSLVAHIACISYEIDTIKVFLLTNILKPNSVRAVREHHVHTHPFVHSHTCRQQRRRWRRQQRWWSRAYVSTVYGHVGAESKCIYTEYGTEEKKITSPRDKYVCHR